MSPYNISYAIEKMIDYSEKNIHDINHFLKVYAYTKTIGDGECLDKDMQAIVELSAIVHDIACPLCRKKYGNANGKYQELEGGPLAERFLYDLGYDKKVVDRVSYIVAHHHTYSDVDGIDYQIMLEADFLVNADESGCDKKAILAMYNDVFKTSTGKRLLKSVYTF